MNGFLQTVMDQKRLEVDQLRAGNDFAEMRGRAMDMPACRDFVAALKDHPITPVIAEVKKASPSLGDIATGTDPATQAATYAAAGAAACSVLCDQRFFKGSLDDLKAVRAAVDLPLLAKDFHIDEIQLAAARLAGADAALLVAAVLTPERLAELYNEALALGLTPLVEVHKVEELPLVLPLDPPLVGINNRNLDTLEIDLQTSIDVRPLIPRDILVVAESGISQAEDIARLKGAGCNAFLIGSALMQSGDPATALRTLCGEKAA